MISATKEFAKRHWPPLRLRVILFGTLLLVAALPGVAALGLRVYENTIVQQTEAELIAEGAVLGSAYKVAWRAGAPGPEERPLSPEPPTIDLRSMPILSASLASTSGATPDPRAIRAAKAVLPIASDATAVTLAATRLLDAHGTVVLGRADVGRNYATNAEVARALAGMPSTVLRGRGNYEVNQLLAVISRASAVRVHHARPVYEGGHIIGIVMLSRTPRGLFVGIYQDRGKIALGIGLILVALVVLVGLLSRGIARPIDALSKASRNVAIGPVAIPDPPVTAAIEIRELYQNFGVMAARIERRSRYLRDFAAALAHEFKTPLAGIRGALELLGDHAATMNADERDRFIGNIAANADRLQRLVQRLLDLARADMMTIDPDAQVDISTVVARVVASAVPEMAIENLVDPDLPAVRITGDVLYSILATLIENSRQAGADCVVVSTMREGKAIAVSVSDNGAGVAVADRDRIFEPFFTGRRDQGGTGLGLAIVRSLLSATGGSIRCEETDIGARFILSVPIADLSAR